MAQITDVTLINLPAPFLEDQLSIYPLGLVNVATYMQRQGYSVGVLDCASVSANGHSLTRAMVEQIRKIESPVVGVSATTPQARWLPLLPMVMKGSVLLVAGGPHATMLPEEVHSLGYDTVVVGEGEMALEESALNIVPKGIVYASAVKNLDGLPFPDRTMVRNYHGAIPVMASRGCAWRCSFCSKPEPFKYRVHSPGYVVEELKTIEQDQIIFFDDTFTMDPVWVSDLCEMIIKSGIRKRFRCSTRADRLYSEIANLMKRAGFEEVCVGVESGSQKILDVLRKHTTPEVNARARKICAVAGLRFKAYIMVGSPGEDSETIRETELWLEANRPDSVGLYLFHPLPGSDIWERPDQYDIKYDATDYEFTYYGGKRHEMVSAVSTAALSKRDLTMVYWRLLDRWAGHC